MYKKSKPLLSNKNFENFGLSHTYNLINGIIGFFWSTMKK